MIAHMHTNTMLNNVQEDTNTKSIQQLLIVTIKFHNYHNNNCKINSIHIAKQMCAYKQRTNALHNCINNNKLDAIQRLATIQTERIQCNNLHPHHIIID